MQVEFVEVARHVAEEDFCRREILDDHTWGRQVVWFLFSFVSFFGEQDSVDAQCFACAIFQRGGNHNKTRAKYRFAVVSGTKAKENDKVLPETPTATKGKTRKEDK